MQSSDLTMLFRDVLNSLRKDKLSDNNDKYINRYWLK
jgi:hypothetical protein